MVMIQLSIAIPTFERKDILKKTLQSIQQQLQPGVEVVVSDNGSLDGTLEMLDALNIPALHVTGFETNQGIDANIVQVIKAAQGEYVLLFSDDDLVTDGLIENILLLLKQSYDVIVLNHFAFDHDPKRPITPPFLPEKDKLFASQEQFFRYAGLGFLSSLVFKRSKALKYVHAARLGKESAHVDIVARIALEPESLCYVAGSFHVAGRALATPRYSMMHSCVVYLHELYQELFMEKKISWFSYQYFYYRLIFKEIPRIYYKLLLQDQKTAQQALEYVRRNLPMLPLATGFLGILKKSPHKATLSAFKIIHHLIKLKRKVLLFKDCINDK